jgi:hypothetical protein
MPRSRLGRSPTTLAKFSSIKAHRNTLPSWPRYGMRSKVGIPLPSHATAPPSVMQDLDRNRASASTISGNDMSGRCPVG